MDTGNFATDDEKTRQELLKYFNDLNEYGYKIEKWISWIEKQGKPTTGEWKKGDIIKYGDTVALVIEGRQAMKFSGEVFTVQYPDEWVKVGSNEVEQFDEGIKVKAHQIAWETSKHYDPNACKQEWCEMAALDMASWIKEQAGQKNTWKPSKEQMGALNWVAYNYTLMDKGTEEKLQSLLNDLKKL